MPSGRVRERERFLDHLLDSTMQWESPYRGQVRLVGGDGVGNNGSSSVSSGRVEVHQVKTWGTVCKNGFNQAAADSVCRQLGYTNAIDIFDAE